jgi:hypothetical protein
MIVQNLGKLDKVEDIERCAGQGYGTRGTLQEMTRRHVGIRKGSCGRFPGPPSTFNTLVEPAYADTAKPPNFSNPPGSLLILVLPHPLLHPFNGYACSSGSYFLANVTVEHIRNVFSSSASSLSIYYPDILW